MSDSREWDLAICRSEYKRLASAHEGLAREHQRTASDLASATYALELSRKRQAVMQRELDASHKRERALLAELHECKRGGSTNVTPLRPRKP